MAFELILSALGLGGIDLLFWAWAIVTVLAFIDILIPDPIPFIDEAVLVTISILLLIALAVRGFFGLVSKGVDFLTQPLVLAFILTFMALWIGNKIYQRQRGKKK